MAARGDGLCDRIVLKDGRIFKGSIINSTPALLVVKLDSGETKPVPRGLISSWSASEPSAPEREAPPGGIAVDDAVFIARGDYRTRLLGEIGSARKSIHVVMYEMHLMGVKDNPPRLIADALAAAAGRGVDVRVLFEDPGEGFILDCNSAAAEYLAAGGVRVKFDDPQRVTHSKLVIIDGETSILGSHNWSASGLRSNSESSVLVRSRPLAAAFSRYFAAAWAKGNAIGGVCERQRRKEARLAGE